MPLARRHRLQQQQRLPRPIDEVFAFFSDVGNLERITPDFLRFRNVGEVPSELRRGTVIDHSIALMGIPMRWRTLIEEFEPNVRFVDRQIRGPYRYWHHLHEFREIPGGTEMLDRVDYELPLSPLSEPVHALFIKRMLRRIFDFRRSTMEREFGIWSERDVTPPVG